MGPSGPFPRSKCNFHEGRPRRRVTALVLFCLLCFRDARSRDRAPRVLLRCSSAGAGLLGEAARAERVGERGRSRPRDGRGALARGRVPVAPRRLFSAQRALSRRSARAGYGPLLASQCARALVRRRRASSDPALRALARERGAEGRAEELREIVREIAFELTAVVAADRRHAVDARARREDRDLDDVRAAREA